jgi:hypothetical protein
MSLTVPTWIAAIATVLLAISVIAMVFFTRASFKAQSRLRDLIAELAELLRHQSSELEHSVDARRRAQACHIFIDLDRAALTEPVPAGKKPAGPEPAAPEPTGGQGWQVTATVHNTSSRPVYDLYLIWQLGTVRMGKPDPVARLMPGQQVSFQRGPESANGDGPVDARTVNAFLTFRDATGIRWTVREDGTLTDIRSTGQPD